MEGYETYMAQVVEASVDGGQIKVHRVVIAVDLGRVVNPNIVEQQLESNIIFGMQAALYGNITLKNGRVTTENCAEEAANRVVARGKKKPLISIALVPQSSR